MELKTAFEGFPKTLTRKQVASVLRGVPFKSKLLTHQGQILVWGLTQDRVFLWQGIGTGKTYTALTLADLWGSERILVVCPNSVVHTWVEQARKHTDLRPYVLIGEAKARRKRLWGLRHRPGVFIVNYEGLKVLFAVQEGRKYMPAGEDADYRDYGFDCFICDESHHLKNPMALQTHVAADLSLQIPNCILMTGTPVDAKNEAKWAQDLWSQYFVLDGGDRLCRSFYMFRSMFFTKSGFDWNLREGAAEDIVSRVADCTLYYSRQECCDLPPYTDEVRRVRLAPKQAKAYEAIRKGLVAELEAGTLKPFNVMARSVKLLQATGGFVYDKGQPVKTIGNSKLDELLAVLAELPKEKVIVYHRFIAEGRLIEKALAKLKIPYASMRGETKDKDGAIRAFIKDVKIKVLVAHPRCGGEGLNLQVASAVIFYGLPYSGILFEQCQGRIYRKGQKKPCLFVYLLAAGTVDEVVYGSLMTKGGMADALMASIAERRSVLNVEEKETDNGYKEVGDDRYSRVRRANLGRRTRSRASRGRR